MVRQSEQYDMVVIGGGMVGAAAALGFAQAGWSVALVEAQLPSEFNRQSEPELRVSAISCRSVTLLQQLGAWAAIQSMRATPYRHLQTWEWDQWQVDFAASSLGLAELGFMLENTVLQRGLWQQFAHTTGLTCYCPDGLTTMTRMEQGWQLTLESGNCLQARLLIGADGAHSRVRQFAGIGITGWQYRQDCLLITVDTGRVQQDTTWQRFYPSGPRAFLPLHDGYATLAWYDHPRRIRQLSAMPPTALTGEIMQAFPKRLGPVQALQAGSFPLVRRHAQRYIGDGLVLLGDAAHTINPLAGQGVNLGYRDLVALLELLKGARGRGESWYAQPVLQRYQRRRRPDNLLMQAGMDLFYTAFSNQLPPLGITRNLALLAAERSGGLKNGMLRYALGI